MYATNGLTLIVDDIFVKAYEKKLHEICTKKKYMPELLENLVNEMDNLYSSNRFQVKVFVANEYYDRDFVSEKMVSELQLLRNISLENGEYWKMTYDDISKENEKQRFSDEYKKIKEAIDKSKSEDDDEDDDDGDIHYKRRNRWREVL